MPDTLFAAFTALSAKRGLPVFLLVKTGKQR
jgi:hypothetical protein